MHTHCLHSRVCNLQSRRKWSTTAVPKTATAALPCQSKSSQASRQPEQSHSILPTSNKAQQTNARQTTSGFRAGPEDEPPSYASIDAVLLNKGIMALFRQKMVEAIGEDSQQTGYRLVEHQLG